MKTIKEFASMGERVYVHLKDEETAMSFLRQAESEGFTFGDGVSPIDHHWSASTAPLTGLGTVCKAAA